MSESKLPTKEANVLRRHKGAILVARFNTDRDYSLSADKDRTIWLWNPHRGIHIKTYKSHGCFNSFNIKFQFSFVSAGFNQSLCAWDCRSHNSVMSVCLTKTKIIGAELSDDWRRPVNCISMSNDGNGILAGCLDSILHLIDISYHFPWLFFCTKLDCCLTNTDAHVTGGLEDGYIFFWGLVDASVATSFRAHSSVVTSVSYHPKDNCMISSSIDGTIRVWKT
ncbi:WD repeat domain-containing protein 83 [Pyrus ussuriensis x Pyrus communis]|uniref:WD repeat domain-containing protein 83 n=1 Tax=Pyrus ussuriensis x Pyrus communis TaxID=2448454 RepID=A0A5N5GPT1_9ROSA|nr:WD repeat domain-containing protein 83 [Pyrus ussuriensis x Pyrus communis]